MQYDSKMITKMFLRLLPVQIFLVAISGLNSIIDGTIAGNCIGPQALAVSSLFAPVWMLLSTLDTVLVTGAQILCGQYLGRNRIDRTRSIFSIDLLTTTCASLIMTLCCLLIPGTLGRLCGATDDLLPDFMAFSRGVSFGLPPFMIATQLTSFLQLEQQEKRTYIGIAIMLVSNIAMDLLFTLVFRMGLFGLGLATAISYWLFGIYLAAYYFKGKPSIYFDKDQMNPADLREILRIGYPGAISQACQVLRGILLNMLMLRYIGSDALSAYAVLSGTFGSMFFAATAGVAAAARLLVSVYSGEEDRTGLKLIIKTSLRVGVPLVAAASLVFVALNVPLTRIFYRDTLSEVYRMTRLGFMIFPLYAPMSCIYLIFQNFHQCFDRSKLTSVLSVFDGVIGIVAPAALLIPLCGIVGLWSSQIINGVITTIIIFLYAVLRNRKVPSNLEELLVLPNDFGVPETDRIDISIRSSEEVVHTSEQISDFCVRHGVDNRRSMIAALAMEEMAGNIVEHGFTKDTKKHNIDVRVIYKNGGLILRLKDDCILFNPKEISMLYDPEDISRNVGIRLISKIADEFTYQNTLGVNVLTIRV